jgi:hypothetical protein
MSIKELWRLGKANDAIRVDSRGKATIDQEKFIKNQGVRDTVSSLQTHRAGNRRPAPFKKRAAVPA